MPSVIRRCMKWHAYRGRRRSWWAHFPASNDAVHHMTPTPKWRPIGSIHVNSSQRQVTTALRILIPPTTAAGTKLRLWSHNIATAQTRVRPWRREGRDRSRLWTWTHAPKHPIRPYCCTEAIPWLGTCYCAKLIKPLLYILHGIRIHTQKKNSAKNNHEGMEALDQTIQPARTFERGHASLTLSGIHTTKRSQVFSAWASSAHKNTKWTRLLSSHILWEQMCKRLHGNTFVKYTPSKM